MSKQDVPSFRIFDFEPAGTGYVITRLGVAVDVDDAVNILNAAASAFIKLAQSGDYSPEATAAWNHLGDALGVAHSQELFMRPGDDNAR